MLLRAVASVVLASSLVAGACKGLTSEDYERLNELFHQSQERQLTPAEVAEIKNIWDTRGDFDWEAVLAALVGIAGGVVGTNKYRNLKAKKSEDI
jgi:hypothetical protein